MNSKEEEDLPDPHETLLVERSHRDFWDTKERLKTAIHRKEIGEYKDGPVSCDDLAPMPREIPTDILKRKAVILEVMDSRMILMRRWNLHVIPSRYIGSLRRREIKNSSHRKTANLHVSSLSC
jgi:hypothetical protein